MEDSLVLASASPRRQELLKLLGLPFTIAISDVDETITPCALPGELVHTLAMNKAQAVAAVRPHSLIIAADTVVALDDRILGKPRHAADAVAMLVALRGRWHRVYTGLVVLAAGTGTRINADERGQTRRLEMRDQSQQDGTTPVASSPSATICVRSPRESAYRTATVITDVLMRDYTDAEITAYVATGDPLDKAAAYAIQHADFHPVAQIVGCHANVMGLPLCDLYSLLARFGVTLPVHPKGTCPAHLGIVCPPSPDY